MRTGLVQHIEREQLENDYPSFNPLKVLADENERNEMCLSHVRWVVKDGKCLTPEHKYDSTNKECRVSTQPAPAAELRRYHNGEIDLPTATYLVRGAYIDVETKRIEQEGIK